MSENTHYDEAAALLADRPGEYEIEKSKALATLALAYEQRTANLIAAFGQLMDGDSDTFLGERVDGLELANEIKERLGLA